MENTWFFIDPSTVDSNVFGLDEVYAVKVKEYVGNGDVRCFTLKGWKTFADLLDYDPRTGRKTTRAKWFIFAAQGSQM
ncbi:MAG: hypothetical protein Q7J27_12370 [Syntrophales bacterium]|nr:hypothetical protein [Syntrophales bacterium]